MNSFLTHKLSTWSFSQRKKANLYILKLIIIRRLINYRMAAISNFEILRTLANTASPRLSNVVTTETSTQNSSPRWQVKTSLQ